MTKKTLNYYWLYNNVMLGIFKEHTTTNYDTILLGPDINNNFHKIVFSKFKIKNWSC